MAIRNIVQDGDTILKKVCRPVTKFDDRLKELLDDMQETMLEANGLGLAGPQVGVLRRVFIALDERNAPGEDATEQEQEEWAGTVVEFINPEILEQRGNVLAYEGCLSYPGEYGAIERPEWVRVRAFDRNGNPFEMEADGILARCICHESNHLDGITIPDLAQYFYDPENPHPLDEADEDEEE